MQNPLHNMGGSVWGTFLKLTFDKLKIYDKHVNVTVRCFIFHF